MGSIKDSEMETLDSWGPSVVTGPQEEGGGTVREGM